jgi:hypothetical protein
MRRLFPLCLALLPMLAHAEGRFLDLLKAAPLQKVPVNQGRTALPDVKLDRIGEDFFCIRQHLPDTRSEGTRCYPATAIRWVSIGSDRTVIEIAQ